MREETWKKSGYQAIFKCRGKDLGIKEIYILFVSGITDIFLYPEKRRVIIYHRRGWDW